TVLLHDGDPVGADPVDPANPMAMRQRILAEAAVRTLAGTGDPLVVNLPATLDPGAAARTMFKDVDVPFIHWVPLASLRRGPAQPRGAAALTPPRAGAARRPSSPGGAGGAGVPGGYVPRAGRRGRQRRGARQPAPPHRHRRRPGGRRGAAGVAGACPRRAG